MVRKLFVALLAAASVGLIALPASSVAKAATSPSCTLSVGSDTSPTGVTTTDELLVSMSAKQSTRFGWALYAEPSGSQVHHGIFATSHDGTDGGALGSISSLEASYPDATSFEFVIYYATGPNPDWSDPLASCTISTS